ncbi:MAG TPA: tetratricopeptide repeat protein [bacterium]|nr:tetratricopeptide repeat protein [bacterium]
MNADKKIEEKRVRIIGAHPYLSLFLMFFALGSFAAEPTPKPTEDTHSLFEKAQKLFDQKDYQEAKDTLNQLVAKHPMDEYIPRARLLLANLQEDFNVSIAQFKSLAAEYADKPEGEEAQKDLGARYYLADKYEEAAKSYHEFLETYPKSLALPEVHYWYAASLAAMDKNDQAVDEYKKVLDLSKDSAWAPKAFLGMGNAYFKMKKYDDARDQYLRILDRYHLYDELNLVYFRLGQTYEAQQKWREAHAAFQTLIQQYPRSFEVAEARDHLRALESLHADIAHAPEAEEPTPTPTVVTVQAAPVPHPGVTPEPVLSKLPSSLAPKPFHVQVGVYSKKVNADKARQAIHKAGYSSYVVTAKQEGVPYPYYKVRVGNYADRASAEKVAKILAQKTKEKAIVIED